MKEIFSPSSKVKANRYGKLPPFSYGVPAPSHGSSSAMPLRYIPAITCLTKLKNERINVTANPIGDQDSKPTLFGAMSKNAFAGDGPQNLSPEDWPSNTLNSPLALRPFINGFTRKPPISFCPWCEPIESANTEGTPGNIKHRIFQRGSRSKNVLRLFLSAMTSAIGKPIPSAAVKATRLSKLPWNVKPDTQRWPNLKPKAHEP